MVASASQLLAVLRSSRQVAACVPGFDTLRDSGRGYYTAWTSLRVGPMRLRLVTRLAASRVSPLGWNIVGAGTNQRLGLKVEAVIKLRLLASESATTTVRLDTYLRIWGRLAELPEPIIRTAEDFLLEAFTQNVRNALAGKRRRAGQVALLPAPSLAVVLSENGHTAMAATGATTAPRPEG